MSTGAKVSLVRSRYGTIKVPKGVLEDLGNPRAIMWKKDSSGEFWMISPLGEVESKSENIEIDDSKREAIGNSTSIIRWGRVSRKTGIAYVAINLPILLIKRFGIEPGQKAIFYEGDRENEVVVRFLKREEKNNDLV